eukprot:gb/GECG01008580.1/.p1 GENE.gb/GECG01008580.1/~~gb/GECG01008580.1/.p1  ORF type:complete len:138 (+),score=15.76 gb/GECG01008580.1/:1-414(+)
MLTRGAKAPRWKAFGRQKAPFKRTANLGDTSRPLRTPPHGIADSLPDESDDKSIGHTQSVASISSVPNAADETQQLIIQMSQDREARAPTLTAKRKQQHIVLATCMWHESPKEMLQWVSSLSNVVANVMETAKRYVM